MSITADPGLVTKGAVHGLTQGYTDIFNCMMIIYVQVSLGGDVEIHQPVTGYLLQHVLEKRHPGIKAALSTAVQVQGDTNAGFPGISFDLGDSISHVKVCYRPALMNLGVVQIAALIKNRGISGGKHPYWNSSCLPGIIEISCRRILKL